MLVIQRRLNEGVVIDLPGGEQLEVSVVKISNQRVSLAFTAPKHIVIDREELRRRIDAEGRRHDG